jgi:hypothetical protein
MFFDEHRSQPTKFTHEQNLNQQTVTMDTQKIEIEDTEIAQEKHVRNQ